jgi:hypothetical protein
MSDKEIGGISLLTESEIFNLKTQGEIIEIQGFDCFNIGMDIQFMKDDLQCDKCGFITKKGKLAGHWYFPVRYPFKQIIVWACGCVDIRDIPITGGK